MLFGWKLKYWKICKLRQGKDRLIYFFRLMDFLWKTIYNIWFKQNKRGELLSMRKKWNILGMCSFVISLAIFVFTYFLYHYLGLDGFGTIYQPTPVKPFVTLLFGIWGVTFLFSSVMSLLVGIVFHSKKTGD